MGIITLLISLIFSCNFINSTLTTNYLTSHPAQLFLNKQLVPKKQAISSLFNFNDNYIQTYHEQTAPAMLSININTKNLNSNNKIYWANEYGGIMGGMVPLKWTYQFNTKIPNSSASYQFNFSNFGYNCNFQQLRLGQVVNLFQANAFVNNFFDNAEIQLPYKMLIACTPYSNISNYFTLKGTYQTHQPIGLNFKKFVTYKLFDVPSFNQFQNLINISLPVTKNNLFLDVNLSKCQNSYQYFVTNIGQLDRYMVCLGDNLNYQYKAHYGNYTSTNIALKIADLLPNLYYFNPQLLFQINDPDSIATNDWAYTNFPSLKVSVNQTLLTVCFDANIIAQLFNIINNYALSTNNQTLLKLNQELWNDKLWNCNLATNIFNFLANKQTYNSTTNTLVLKINQQVDIQSLINYLQMALSKKQVAKWVWWLVQSTHDSSLMLSSLNCINLYQTLLTTYQKSKISYTFITSNSTATYSLTYPNLMISLNASNCSKYVLPYDYYYQIANARYQLNNYYENFVLNNQFDIIKYPNVITNYVVNNQIEPINQNQVKIIPLTLFNSLPSLTLFNLEQEYKVSSTQLNNVITQFNANYNSSINAFNNYLNNPLTLGLIKLAIYHSFYSLFSSQNIINYCNQYGFDNNLLNATNSSLFSNFRISSVNSKLGIFQTQFAINNQLDFMQLLDDDYLEVNGVITLNKYHSIVNGYFYLSNNILHQINHPIKKVVPVVKPTPIVHSNKDKPPPVQNHPKKVVQPVPNKKELIPVTKPTSIIPKVSKPVTTNNHQPIQPNKPQSIPPWGYVLIVLPLILLGLGFVGFYGYLKIKTLIIKKKQKQ